MDLPGFEINDWPDLRKPVMVVGLGGWGNALNVAKGSAAYIARRAEARRFGALITRNNHGNRLIGSEAGSALAIGVWK